MAQDGDTDRNGPGTERRSLVERAVERLGRSGPEGDALAETPRPAPAPGPSAAPQAHWTSGRDAGVQTAERPGNAAAVAERRTTRNRAKIDMDSLRAAGFVTSHTDRTQIAEEFRLIKRPLLLKAFATPPEDIENGNLIMVTSAKSGEGKTFCAVSLAMSIALERDLTVLLIDADVAKPDIPRTLGIEAEKGLVDLIADDDLDLSDVLIRTNLENLTVLPAGRQHHLATELLASDKMDRFVDEIARRYPDRVIIFDSPPALMSSVPGVLALHVGQTLFVVESQRTAQAAVENALGLIGSCKNISLLLNKAQPRGNDERFGAYYGEYR